MAINERETNLKLKTYNDITVVGVGGVGSWVAYLLAMSGHVERITIIDPDVVEDSNLNRTPYRIKDIGVPKVFALADIIKDARYVQVIPIMEYFENVRDVPTPIIDCRDFVSDDIRSDIVAGYDGTSMTIHINPSADSVFSTVNSHGYTVPSYIVPPVFLASVIVEYYLHPSNKVSSEIIRTFDIRDFVRNIVGEYRDTIKKVINEDDEYRTVIMQYTNDKYLHVEKKYATYINREMPLTNITIKAAKKVPPKELYDFLGHDIVEAGKMILTYKKQIRGE